MASDSEPETAVEESNNYKKIWGPNPERDMNEVKSEKMQLELTYSMVF